MAYIKNGEIWIVYSTELQSIKLALQITNKDIKKGNKRDNVIIFMDNQAAIRTFQILIGRSRAYTVAEAIPLINKLQRDRGMRVDIRWVPAPHRHPGK
jgi:hypothetical protein